MIRVVMRVRNILQRQTMFAEKGNDFLRRTAVDRHGALGFINEIAEIVSAVTKLFHLQHGAIP